MKQVIFALMLVPVMGFAEVADFNSMINENAKAQAELQEQLKDKSQVAQKALNQGRKSVVVVQSETYNAPTSAKALKFEKEVRQHVPNSKKELERLADEINSVKEY